MFSLVCIVLLLVIRQLDVCIRKEGCTSTRGNHVVLPCCGQRLCSEAVLKRRDICHVQLGVHCAAVGYTPA